jgi:hypothetical protein
LDDPTVTILINLAPFVLMAGIVWWVWRSRRKHRAAIAGEDGADKNLLPLAAYDVDETGYWRRLPWVVGIFFGGAIAALALISPIPGTQYSPPVTAAISLALGGPFFGILFPAMMRSKVRSMTAALYRGESSTIDAPESDRPFTWRLACTLIQGNIGVGGILYIGHVEVWFDAHKKSRRRGQQLKMGPANGLMATLAEPPKLNRLQRLLIPHPTRLIELSWSDGKALILTPDPDGTIEKLQRCLEELR